MKKIERVLLMQPIEKLKNRLNDAIEQIELSLETKLENKSSVEALI